MEGLFNKQQAVEFKFNFKNYYKVLCSKITIN